MTETSHRFSQNFNRKEENYMAKLTKEDAFEVSQDIINDAIPVIEDMLDEVFKKYPIDMEIRKAILHSVLVAHKLSTETTVSLLVQLVNSQDN